jgi:hypothetical protein
LVSGRCYNGFGNILGFSGCRQAWFKPPALGAGKFAGSNPAAPTNINIGVKTSKVKCCNCNKLYTKSQRRINESNRNNWKFYCSRKCLSEYRTIKIPKKICPVCEKEFEKKSKTCSHSCANVLFHSGEGNGNWKESCYRTTCFLYHKKECIICGEKNIVHVHHFDENKKNNKPENLIPLCPTHHQYWHSRYRKLIEKKVLKYQKEFIDNKEVI